MIRRKFLQLAGALGLLDAQVGIPHLAAQERFGDSGDEREQWIKRLTKLADPLLNALSEDKLKEMMPVETRESYACRGEEEVHASGRIWAAAVRPSALAGVAGGLHN